MNINLNKEFSGSFFNVKSVTNQKFWVDIVYTLAKAYFENLTSLIDNKGKKFFDLFSLVTNEAPSTNSEKKMGSKY